MPDRPRDPLTRAEWDDLDEDDHRRDQFDRYDEYLQSQLIALTERAARAEARKAHAAERQATVVETAAVVAGAGLALYGLREGLRAFLRY
jgi:hypothetical protein